MQKEISDAHPGLLRDLNFNPVVNKNRKELNRKQIQCYNNKGYIFPIEVFSETEFSIHRKYFNWIIETEIQNERGGYSINGWHCHDPHIYDLIVDNRILDYVGDLLGEISYVGEHTISVSCQATPNESVSTKMRHIGL